MLPLFSELRSKGWDCLLHYHPLTLINLPQTVALSSSLQNEVNSGLQVQLASTSPVDGCIIGWHSFLLLHVASVHGSFTETNISKKFNEIMQYLYTVQVEKLHKVSYSLSHLTNLKKKLLFNT